MPEGERAHAHHLLFVILPYAAATLVVVTLQRYFKKGFSFSSLSSQFLKVTNCFTDQWPGISAFWGR
jgi:hypothetical protein